MPPLWHLIHGTQASTDGAIPLGLENTVAIHHSSRMPQSHSAVYIHLVFSTKDRRPLPRDKPTREALHSYLGGVSKKLDSPLSSRAAWKFACFLEENAVAVVIGGARRRLPAFACL